MSRLVALKFLRGGERDGGAARARLLREAKNASALNHPHIATIYEVGESGGRAYIAMEFVEGRSLSDVLRARFARARNRDLATDSRFPPLWLTRTSAASSTAT